MSPQDLADTELPPFKACIQVGYSVLHAKLVVQMSV
jgi:hypothetical protein